MKSQFENRNPKSHLTRIAAAFCVIFLAFNAVSFSQLTQQVSFDFTGITTCDNEMIYNVPNLIGEPVDGGIPIQWTRNSGALTSAPICTQTSGTNNMFNSKCWNLDALGYDADGGNATYLKMSYRLKSDRYFVNISGGAQTQLQFDFTLKRFGNGPNKGFFRVRFLDVWGDTHLSPSSWNQTAEWNFNNSSTNILSYNSGLNGAFVPPVGSTEYDAVEVEIHAWDAGNCSGQGSSLALDGITVSHPDPLPVELVSLTTSVAGKAVTLKWKTATEANNYGFDVERSANNRDWKTIGFVEGHGSVNTPQDYSFVDQNAASAGNKVYYRLKQIDRDGTSDYSPIVVVNFNSATREFAITAAYPNPFNPTTTLSYYVPQASKVSLKLYNTVGQEVKTLFENEVKESGVHTVMINADGLASGSYFAWLQAAGMKSVYKVVLSK